MAGFEDGRLGIGAHRHDGHFAEVEPPDDDERAGEGAAVHGDGLPRVDAFAGDGPAPMLAWSGVCASMSVRTVSAAGEAR